MNCRRVVDHSRCYFHPDLALVGVCPLCLNDRLVVLAAARQNRLRRLFSSCARRAHRCNRPSRVGSKKTPINILKIFTIGSLLNRLEFRHRRTDGLDGACDASSSLEGKRASISGSGFASTFRKFPVFDQFVLFHSLSRKLEFPTRKSSCIKMAQKHISKNGFSFEMKNGKHFSQLKCGLWCSYIPEMLQVLPGFHLSSFL